MDHKQVSYTHEDRQWDARINVQTKEYFTSIVNNIKAEQLKGKFKYILIGGIEVGTRPNQGDYQIKHVHIAVIFNNRASKASILKNWGIIEGNGYYLVPRKRELPYSGWRNHHIKEFSKFDPSETIIYEAGELPKDQGEKRSITRSDAEKKETTDEVIRKIRRLIEDNKEEEAFQTYPRNYMMYGEKLKSMITQKLQAKSDMRNPHIWLHGFPGTGKTAILRYIYPDMYKKDLNNRFFDLYDPKVHTHIMLEDLDHQNVEKLGIQFLKTLCDEGGFPIDQKYKTPQLTRSTILVSSNFTIDDIVPEGKGVDETKAALFRRFLHVRIDDLLRLLGLKLIPNYERKQLKLRGVDTPGAIFMTWDYMYQLPTGMPINSPKAYEEIIRNAYHK